MVREFYNPEIRIPKKDTREAFALAELDPNLETVPGIKNAHANMLRNYHEPLHDHEPIRDDKEPITTTYQLIGKFLMLREEGDTGLQQCDKMYKWLGGVGISNHRHTIIVCLAAKINTMIPNYFGEDVFPRDDGIHHAADAQNRNDAAEEAEVVLPEDNDTIDDHEDDLSGDSDSEDPAETVQNSNDAAEEVEAVVPGGHDTPDYHTAAQNNTGDDSIISVVNVPL